MAIDPITGIIEGVIGIVNRIFPDKTEAQKQAFQVALQQMLADKELALKQLDVNAVEAASSNLFVAGWRPFIGWVCSTIFLWTYLLQPLLVFLLTISGNPVPPMPTFGGEAIMPVLLGLLGLGGLRTYEKIKGTNK